MIPLNIVNKILVYVSELNNNLITTQYCPITNKEYYKINFNSNLLWKIEATLMMKKIYPIINANFKSSTFELYKFGISHYEKTIQLMNKKYPN